MFATFQRPDKIKIISIAVRDGSIVPFKRYKLGDDIRVRIKRGIVNVDASVTLRGQRYIGKADGSESLWFDFFIKDALEFNIYSSNRTNSRGNTGTDNSNTNKKPGGRNKKPGSGTPVSENPTQDELAPPADESNIQDPQKPDKQEDQHTDYTGHRRRKGP